MPAGLGRNWVYGACCYSVQTAHKSVYSKADNRCLKLTVLIIYTVTTASRNVWKVEWNLPIGEEKNSSKEFPRSKTQIIWPQIEPKRREVKNDRLSDSVFSNQIIRFISIFDRSTCSKRSKESLLRGKKSFVSIYSILAYFTMFSFRVLTCSKIVSIHIILNLNKFRQVWTCSDMFENPMNCNN